MTVAPRVLHLTYREGLSSVFMAQVAKPMTLLKRQGVDVSLAVVTPLGEFTRPVLRARWAQQRKALRETDGPQLSLLPSPPARLRSLWREDWVVGAAIRRAARRNGSLIVHCRNAHAARLARSACDAVGARLVYDCRGAEGPEYLYVNGFARAEDAPTAIREEHSRRDGDQRAAARQADAVLVVSQAMKRWVVDQWGLEPDCVTVTPCCTETPERFETVAAARRDRRMALGLENAFVFAYCGSLEPWQAPQKLLCAARRLLERREDARFLAITTKPDAFRTLAAEAGVPADRLVVISVPQRDVAANLAAADLGALIRDPSPVNAVASPVKFAEYLAAGVPTLISEGVGDHSELVRARGVGAVIAEPFGDASVDRALSQAETLVDAEGETLRQRCWSAAREALSWPPVIDQIAELYAALAAQPASAAPDVPAPRASAA